MRLYTEGLKRSENIPGFENFFISDKFKIRA